MFICLINNNQIIKTQNLTEFDHKILPLTTVKKIQHFTEFDQFFFAFDNIEKDSTFHWI
jgi:hypothetical protein